MTMHIGCAQCKKELGAFDLKPQKCEPKPEPKPDFYGIVIMQCVFDDIVSTVKEKHTFDGETGELKSAEVMK